MGQVVDKDNLLIPGFVEDMCKVRILYHCLAIMVKIAFVPESIVEELQQLINLLRKHGVVLLQADSRQQVHFYDVLDLLYYLMVLWLLL